MQLSVLMGDPRHKKSPPSEWPMELNTEMFRDAVEQVLSGNATKNRLAGRKRGSIDSLIESHADVARELSKRAGKKIGQRMVDRILGGSREGTEVELVGTSDYIKPIREMLGIDLIQIAVPADRADVLREIAALPDKEFAAYRSATRPQKTAVSR